jgi:type IV pilus assembly protein PilN
MKHAVNVNLASEPFRRDRPILVASIAVAVVMAVLLALQIYLIRIERGEGTETTQAIAETEQQLQALRSEEAGLRNELLRPENEIVLDQSVFLNALLLRKGISWTLLFSDLEEVLPYNVKLVQIRPQVTGNNDIQLEMMVASQETEPVIEMLRSMENSPLFSSTSVSASLPPTDSEPLHRYRVTVDYEREL